MRTDAATIGQLAAQAGLTADTLRYYERVGLLPHPARTRGGYRLYGPSTLERLSFIRKAQALGLTLGEILDVLRLAADGTRPCAHVRQALDTKLTEIDARIEELRSLRTDLARALRRSNGSPPAGARVCDIIERQDVREPLPRSAGRTGRQGR